MEMRPILKQIKLYESALILKRIFTNEEMAMSAKTNFICCNCNYENQIEIVPYSSVDH